MTLFLAAFNLKRVVYMSDGPSKTSPKIRLVRAKGVDEAEQKLKAETERNDPYGVSYYVVDLDITACIE
jgi:hypothetical protein